MPGSKSRVRRGRNVGIQRRASRLECDADLSDVAMRLCNGLVISLFSLSRLAKYPAACGTGRHLTGGLSMESLEHCRNRRELLEVLNCEAPDGVGIEVGAHSGLFSRVILKHWSKARKLYLLDLWAHQPNGYTDGGCNSPDDVQEERYRQVVKYFTEQYGERAGFVRAWSHLGAEAFPDEHFDFIYIDANHSYAAVKQDLLSWYPKTKRGAVIAGHDYAMGDINTYCAKKAVDEFAAEHGLCVHVTSQEVVDGAWEGVSWMIRKPR